MTDIIINWWVVLSAAVAYMVIGFVWYGPLFGSVWKRLAGISDQEMKSMKMSASQAMFLGFVFAVVMAYVLAHFVYIWGAFAFSDAWWLAFWLWLGFVATTQVGSVLWENKPWKLFFLNAAASLLSLWAMASILVKWG